MTKDQDSWEFPQPLIPSDKGDDRPMIVVLAILAFLMTMTLLGVKSSYAMGNNWKSELDNKITIQIIPISGVERDVTAEKARGILAKNSEISSVKLLGDEYSRKLLEPWLGDVPLPAGVELPILLGLEINDGETISPESLATTLQNENINAIVDTHDNWTSQVERSILALKSVSMLALILVTSAILAAVVFATRAVLNGRRKLINVLHQIGAAPKYTAALFGKRFARVGLKAGAIGSLGAIIVLIIVGIVTAGSLQILPRVSDGIGNLLLACLVPIVIALICAGTAWKTVLKILYEEVYP